MDVEWEDLRTIKRPNPKDKGKGVWDESKVLEAKDAATKQEKRTKRRISRAYASYVTRKAANCQKDTKPAYTKDAQYFSGTTSKMKTSIGLNFKSCPRHLHSWKALTLSMQLDANLSTL